jgi:prepilin-type N-terminal cleavage/methylation domain-containing protein
MTRRSAFTLVEMLAAMAITTIVLAATVSAALLAGRAVPDPKDAASAAMDAARAADQIAAELETATLVVEQTATSLAFVVPPRGSDTNGEYIRYSWAGTSGSPLLRQYNRGPPVAAIDQVDQFSVTPTISTSTETYGGLVTEDSAESLLIDYSGTSNLTAQSVTSTNWQGQYFLPASLPAGVIAWRPTRVTFQAKQSALVATTNVQMMTPDANLLPTGSAVEQYTLLGSGLGSGYAWQSFSFSQVGRLAPSSGICLVLQWVTGSPNSLIAQSNNGAGLVQTTNAGSTWTYSSNKSLQSQLYGKLTHQGSPQTMTSKYLTAASLSLRASRSSNPAVQATAQALNHPEMLGAYWELKFDRDPTALDVNGDGVADWSVHGGGSFSAGGLLNLTWQANGSGLDSQPGDNFARLTAIDVRFRASGSSGSWAQLALNAARSGSTCAPILARVTLQNDGTQTVNTWRKLDDLTSDPLATVTGLAGARPIDVHLVIDPAYGSVAVSVNGVQYGTFPYNAFASSDSSRSVSLTSNGTAEFDYVRVREVMP